MGLLDDLASISETFLNRRTNFIDDGLGAYRNLLIIFQYLAGVEFDDKTVMSLIRLTGIWQERQIFDKKILQEIR
jgi:hypothetical protein